MNSVQRLDLQRLAEQMIKDLNPDLYEACDLLDAVMASLENRYSSARLMVVTEEYKALRIAMQEAYPTELSLEDEAYMDWLARHECD